MVSSILRGGRYDTISTRKCMMYHPCLVTKKCQNYDPNRRECFLCEQRVRPARNLKGLVPEGVKVADVQLAIRTIERFMKQPFSSPDRVANPLPAGGFQASQDPDFEAAMQTMSEYTNG